MVLISKYVLDCVKYNNECRYVNWQMSDIRAWLNYDFLNEAFNEEECDMMLVSEVTADDYHLEALERELPDQGNTTYDKVYLLSEDEVEEYFYTADNWQENQANSSCCATPYAYVHGEILNEKIDSPAGSAYWLRTMATSSYNDSKAVKVGLGGYFRNELVAESRENVVLYYYSFFCNGVRPVIAVSTRF